MGVEDPSHREQVVEAETWGLHAFVGLVIYDGELPARREVVFNEQHKEA